MNFGISYSAVKDTLTALKNRKVAKEIKAEQLQEDEQSNGNDSTGKTITDLCS